MNTPDTQSLLTPEERALLRPLQENVSALKARLATSEAQVALLIQSDAGKLLTDLQSVIAQRDAGLDKSIAQDATIKALIKDLAALKAKLEAAESALDGRLGIGNPKAVLIACQEYVAAEDELPDWCDSEDYELSVAVRSVVSQLDEMQKENEQLRKACADMREALIPFQCETCNGTHLFTFECPACLAGEGQCSCDKLQPEPCPQCQSDNGLREIYAKLEKALTTTAFLEEQEP